MKHNETDTKQETNRWCMIFLAIAVFGIIFFTPTKSLIVGRAILDQELQQTPEVIQTSPDEAITALMHAESVMKDLQLINTSSFFVEDTLLEAKKYFIGDGTILQSIIEAHEGEKRTYLETLPEINAIIPSYDRKNVNYSHVIVLTERINKRKQQALALMDSISLVEDKLQQYQLENINTSAGEKILKEAKQAFEEERFNEAEDLLIQAEQALDASKIETTRLEGLVDLSKNFIQKYWILIITLIALIAYSVKPIYKHQRKRKAQKKLKTLQQELKSMRNAMIDLQIHYFKKKTLSKSQFDQRIEQYRKRTIELKHTIPVLKAMAQGKKYEKKKIKQGLLVVKK